MTDQLKTLPTIALERSRPLDVLRSLIRRDPILAALGVKLGATRAYNAAEADQIIAAFDSRKTKGTTPEMVAV